MTQKESQFWAYWLGDCDDTVASINPDATERCNGVDDDCDGSIDESSVEARTEYLDQDGDGHGDPATRRWGCPEPDHVPLGDDCDDADPTRHPGQLDACNDRDDDCDEYIDEDCVDETGDSSAPSPTPSTSAGAPDEAGGCACSETRAPAMQALRWMSRRRAW